jgi:hypothetical protein
MSEDWEAETQDVKKLTKKPRHIAAPKPKKRTTPKPPLTLQYIDALHLPQLREDTIIGVDGGTAKRLKRGELAIDYTLDLHGMTQEEAFAMRGAGDYGEGERRGGRCAEECAQALGQPAGAAAAPAGNYAGATSAWWLGRVCLVA